MGSINLNTRVKDKRNLFANLSYHYDKSNVPFTKEDEQVKRDIFAIPDLSTDFITRKKLTGIGDHYFPLAGKYKTEQCIGSDSQWNRIPVSGYNSNYKKYPDPDAEKKINSWLEYVRTRGAKMYYSLTSEHVDIVNKLERDLVSLNEAAYRELCDIPL